MKHALSAVLIFSASACLSTAGLDDGSSPSSCSNVQTDVANCGKCGNSCGSVAGGLASCMAGSCIATCSTGRGDCDSSYANGCEVTFATDGENCGACGRSCLGGTCTNGSCDPVTLQTLSGLATGVAVDDTSVYYGLNPPGGTTSEIVRIDKDGANAKPIVTGMVAVGSVAVDGTFVYWVEPASNGTANGRILKSAKDGSAGVITIASALGVDAHAQLTLAPPKIFWSSFGVLAADNSVNGAGMYACDLSGCGDTPTAISKSAYVNGGIIDGALIYYAQAAVTPQVGVFSCPVAGCGTTPKQLAGATVGAFQITADSAAIYWTTLSGAVRYDKSAATLSTVVTTTHPLFGIVVDANNVYFTDTSDGTVASCPITGCTAAPNTYASALVNPGYLAEDAAALYFSSGSVSAGTISRVSK